MSVLSNGILCSRSPRLESELRLYYDAVRDTDAPAVPTYLVSGEVPALTVIPLPGTQQSESAMDIDLEFEEDKEDKDVVYQSKILLVDARTLDGACLVHTDQFTLVLTLCLEAVSQFSRIHSVHVYSLSPSRFGVRTPSTWL